MLSPLIALDWFTYGILLVDRPTQLISTWRNICCLFCKYTHPKDTICTDPTNPGSVFPEFVNLCDIQGPLWMPLSPVQSEAEDNKLSKKYETYLVGWITHTFLIWFSKTVQFGSSILTLEDPDKRGGCQELSWWSPTREYWNKTSRRARWSHNSLTALERGACARCIVA